MSDTSKSNVLPLKTEKPTKTKKSELFYRMARHMNGYDAGLRTPFNRTFVLLEQSEHVYAPAEVVSDTLMTVQFVPASEIRKAVLQWVWEYGPNRDWHWTVDDAKKCLDMWLDLTPHQPMPDAVAFASEDKWCFTKHVFDPEPVRSLKTWEEIISRTSNGLGLQCFIGSLFYPDSKQQQYLWLKGSGQDSKGCITRLLKKLLGSSCKSANPPVKGQNPGFWLDNLMRAKCVVFNDINDRGFITTGLGKSLSGGDVQSCERKYGPSYDAIFNGKLIFTSNWTPDISSEHSDQRRIIYCELEEKADKTIDPAYEAKLLLEAPGIIKQCMDLYEEHCMPLHKPIPTDNAHALLVAEENEQDYELLMERFNFIGIDPTIPLADNKKMPETDFTSEVRHFFRGQPKQARQGFKKWLIRKYANRLQFGPVKEGQVTKRFVVGLTKKATL